MKILSMDTSTKTFSLAVSDGGKVLRSRNIKLNKVLSSSIIPSIDRTLKAAGFPFSSLDGFAVGLGPGSFTSLRVGLSTVKAFALATGKPVVGIPSLDVLARNVPGTNVRIAVVCDAKRSLVYACLYERKDGVLKRKSPYLLLPVEKFLARIKGETVFTGDGTGLYRAQIDHWAATRRRPGSGNSPAVFLEEKYWTPKAACLAALAQERFQAGTFDAADTLTPLYLYPEDCQVDRGKK